jgi:hypothetical protein
VHDDVGFLLPARRLIHKQIGLRNLAGCETATRELTGKENFGGGARCASGCCRRV